ncbi:sexual stage-specific protein precursor, putative [Plasmodium gallinaceum]|uniref:Sexual stage-specific protein, putative n=1 Tax=Plasmodium gallinaceum TaxID=5849 RepID=A0A1J1GZT8_PLAGA|nr:sexual stage-specific protein precursor, putative [Plasmodium gallinaceum]CRG98134.1 sexual stage-specific protein precursor, putative [Plasmodium gallinaceum]
MNFRKLISSLSLVLILYSIVELAFANADEKTKKSPGKGNPVSTTSSNQSDTSLKDAIDRIPAEAQQALEEIKVISNMLDKKTSVNRNLIIGTAVTNIALLLMLSGLMGYNTRKMAVDDGEGKDKAGKKKDVKGECCKETDEAH